MNRKSVIEPNGDQAYLDVYNSGYEHGCYDGMDLDFEHGIFHIHRQTISLIQQ